MIDNFYLLLDDRHTLREVVVHPYLSGKLDELTREVRMHNNFAQRVPVIEEQVKVINHRIADLEEGK